MRYTDARPISSFLAISVAPTPSPLRARTWSAFALAAFVGPPVSSPSIHSVSLGTFTLFSVSYDLNIPIRNGDTDMSGDSPGRAILDPFGEPLTVETLPPGNTVRWVPRRKAQVVCAIRGGLISREEACDRYGISDAELFSWERLLDEHGLRALHATRAQRYRTTTTSTDQDIGSS